MTRSFGPMHSQPLNNISTAQLNSKRKGTKRDFRLSSSLRYPHPGASVDEQNVRPNRHFTIHPDETADEDGSRCTVHPDCKAGMSLKPDSYLDLFSPVKPTATEERKKPVKKTLTSPRTGPQLSDKTLKSPAQMTLEPPLMDSHETGSEAARSQTGRKARTSHVRRTGSHISPLKKFNSNSKPGWIFETQRGKGVGTAALPPNENAKVLADIRNMSQAAQSIKHSSCLAPFASSKNRRPHPANPLPSEQALHSTNMHQLSPRTRHASLLEQKGWHSHNSQGRGARCVDEALLDQTSDVDEGDIWITDYSEKESSEPRRHRMASLARAPSRHKLPPKCEFNTSNAQSPLEDSSALSLRHLDGSTTEEVSSSAHSNLSSEEVFTRSFVNTHQLPSQDSCVSSRPANNTEKLLKKPRSRPDQALKEVTGNTSRRPVARSPLHKAKVVKVESPSDRFRDKGNETGSLAKSSMTHCLSCTETNAKAAALEDEVARLKGEVLALRAALRRNGAPLTKTAQALR